MVCEAVFVTPLCVLAGFIEDAKAQGRKADTDASPASSRLAAFALNFSIADLLPDSFEKPVGSAAARIEVAERKSATLAAIRDALLPRLPSGEIRIGVAARALGEVP